MNIKIKNEIVNAARAISAGVFLTCSAIAMLVLVVMNVNTAPWSGVTEISILAGIALVLLLPIGIILLVQNPYRVMAFALPFSWWLVAPLALPWTSSPTLVDGFSATDAIRHTRLLG